MDCDFSKYKLLIAPMLYMVRPGVAERIEKFVADGGTFVTTYWSGIVDENDLCFLGGFPGPLRKVTGIWSEEIDALYDHDVNFAVPVQNNPLNLDKEYKAMELCDLIHAETAEVLATYKCDFYKDRPALTVNKFGDGKAYYIAFRSEVDFLTDFYTQLIKDLNISRVLEVELPEGVTAQKRTDGENDYIFIMNFSTEEKIINLPQDAVYTDMLCGSQVEGSIVLSRYGIRILKRS